MANKAVAKVRAEVLKADVSQQLSSEEAYSSNGWLEPPLPLEGLKVLVNNSTILPQCINAYKTNIAGYGIGVKYRDGDQEETSETKAEWDALQDIMNLFTIEMDTKELFEQVVEARETFGIAYLEVIRSRGERSYSLTSWRMSLQSACHADCSLETPSSGTKARR